MKNFTLFSLMRIALKHIVLLMVTAVVFAAAAFVYCEFLATPVYTAKGSLLVTNGGITEINNSESSTLNNTDIMASINFSDTVMDILKTKGIYKELSNSLGNKYTYADLSSKASVTEAADNSLFMNIEFSASTKAEAIELVNAYLNLAPDYINKFVPGVRTVVAATADNAVQTYPQPLVFSFAAAVVGAVAVYLILLLIYSANNVIRGEDDFKERFDTLIIGSIPDFAAAKNEKYYKSSYYGAYYGNKEGNTSGK